MYDRDDAQLSNHGQFQGLKLIPNPPNLDEWREKLFHVDEMITLTEEQYDAPHLFPALLSHSNLDSKCTSHTSITSTRTARRRNTNATALYRITGTVG